MAKATDNVSSGVDSNEIIVENTGAQQAADMHLTQVHKAKVGLGLATITRVGLKEKNEIMKCTSGAQSLTGSPKTKTSKSKRIVSKIAPPDWLKKWQKIAAESPPVNKKLQILTPLKAKSKNPQHIFSSPKKKLQPQKSQKAKSLESIRKEQKKKLDKKDQNIQKEKNKAEKITSSSTNTNMFKLMPQAKFKVATKTKIPPCFNFISKQNNWWQPTSKPKFKQFR